MATVYLAEDLKHHRQVAIKVLRPEVASALGGERFLREIEVTSRLDHPYILPLLDSGEAAGLLYYVMPYVEGETLRDRLQRERQLPMDDAIQIACEVADALSYAHGLGFVHRDIKPENILLAAGHVRVADFGIARAIRAATGDRLTATGLAVGTPVYMSPEQGRGEPRADPRADVYSLGCVLYEMVAGQPPYTGATAEAILARKCLEPLPSLRIVRDTTPATVERAIAKALAKVPADRFATVSQFADALQRGRSSAPEGAYLPPRPTGHRRVLLVAASAFAMVLGGWAIVVRLGSAPPRIDALAVLPVETEAQHGALGDAIHRRLIDELSHVRSLRVTAEPSSRRYRGTTKPVPAIAKELNVDALIETFARPVGDDLQLHVRLISAGGSQLWAREFATDARQMDRLQKQVTREIVSFLKVPLTREERQRLDRARASDPRSYESYQRGLRLQQAYDPDRFGKSIAAFEEAIRLDPDDPAPYVALANLYTIMGFGHDTIPPAEAFRHARELAKGALRVDPDNSDAHATMGTILSMWDWDWAGAEREFKLAILTNPGSATAHWAYGVYLRMVGASDSAVAEHQRARAIDPFSTLNLADLAIAYLGTGRPDSALKWARQALDLDPNSPPVRYALSITFMMQGQHDSSVAHQQRAAALNPTFRTQLAVTYAAAGRHADFDRVMASFSEREKRRWAAFLAAAYAARGDRKAAFQALEIAIKEHSPGIHIIRSDPGFRNLTSDPRYRMVLQRLGLPAP
jgi:eukaryotic-like serine/threonine-protein kinase